MVQTSNPVAVLHIPVLPVPASRPRVTRWGTYFAKNYEDFRKDMHRFLLKIKGQYPQDHDSTFKVHITFICRKPKKPSNVYPVGDVDNFLKGPLDAITKAEMFWKDDTQITYLSGDKRYQNEGEEFGLVITINKN